MSLPRYGLNWECDETGGSEWAVIPDEDGEYVLFTDHKAKVEQLQAALERSVGNNHTLLKKRQELLCLISEYRADVERLTFERDTFNKICAALMADSSFNTLKEQLRCLTASIAAMKEG